MIRHRAGTGPSQEGPWLYATQLSPIQDPAVPWPYTPLSRLWSRE